MKFLKKSLSTILSLIMGLTILFSFPISATPNKFDINNYTIEDLQNMNLDERRDLLYKFINEYNPYGLKELNSNYYNRAQPLWQSGAEDNLATHELITMQALLCFINDYGFYNINGTEALAVTLTLAAASGLPDKDEIGNTFAGHFYDPDTQKNWAGSKTNTAKTNAQSHYNNAYNKLKTNVNMSVNSAEFAYVLEELGRALHYIQDASQPHHANNKVAIITNHSDYEKYVDGKINSYIGNIESTPKYYYSDASRYTVANYTHNAAVVVKPFYDSIKHNNNKTYWDLLGTAATQSATYYSSGVIYKLFNSCGASFA